MPILAVQASSTLGSIELLAAPQITAVTSFADALQSAQSNQTTLAMNSQTGEAAPLDEWTRNFHMDFPSDYPHDLSDKLKMAWNNCKTSKERETFCSMYYGIFVPTQLPTGKPVWDSNWQGTLRETLQANSGLAGSIPLEYRAGYIKVCKMAEQLLG
jgi:hypothetical protein